MKLFQPLLCLLLRISLDIKFSIHIPNNILIILKNVIGIMFFKIVVAIYVNIQQGTNYSVEKTWYLMQLRPTCMFWDSFCMSEKQLYTEHQYCRIGLFFCFSSYRECLICFSSVLWPETEQITIFRRYNEISVDEFISMFAQNNLNCFGIFESIYLSSKLERKRGLLAFLYITSNIKKKNFSGSVSIL